ncbi:hypothetical protein PACTADRAFT_52056 [Pachysolen tannophilus NRRL Y-2460]|uniref:Uncharacterized protein n=1 Tax=Pachysolen tannophilus NRRL Y-2460 TaxID=669874 RepID=A0A1E4TP11_PACTA|nr:hypothetical protein PACTADRAFT_52056 [Pachysolen tannophilus NRRL Y-2460]
MKDFHLLFNKSLISNILLYTLTSRDSLLFKWLYQEVLKKVYLYNKATFLKITLSLKVFDNQVVELIWLNSIKNVKNKNERVKIWFELNEFFELENVLKDYHNHKAEIDSIIF